MTFKIDQKTDCDIKSAESLCRQIFEANGYIVEIKGNNFSFLRKTKKSFNELMPIYELLRGFGEGKMSFRKQNDFLKVKVRHRRIMHTFTSLLLIGMFTYIFFGIAGNFKINQLIIALCIVSPISLIGYFKSKNELQEIFDEVFENVKRDFNIILD